MEACFRNRNGLINRALLHLSLGSSRLGPQRHCTEYRTRNNSDIFLADMIMCDRVSPAPKSCVQKARDTQYKHINSLFLKISESSYVQVLSGTHSLVRELRLKAISSLIYLAAVVVLLRAGRRPI